MGGLGQDRAPMRLIANPNIQRLKAAPEETQAMGGVKIPQPCSEVPAWLRISLFLHLLPMAIVRSEL